MPKFNKKISDTEIRLGEVRFSYANVFSKRMNPDGTARNDGMYFNRGTGNFGYGNDK
jgi:hypothetical protein